VTSAVGFRLLHLDRLKAQLARITPEIQDRLRIFMAQFVIDLRSQVQANILERFKATRDGLLFMSVQSQMIEEVGSVTGRVFIDGVPYAAIQEYGGETPAGIVITPVNALALAFFMRDGMMPGNTMPGRSKMGFSSGDTGNALQFAKQVVTAGSIIPERSYMRLALVQTRPIFEGGIRDVVNASIAESTKV